MRNNSPECSPAMQKVRQAATAKYADGHKPSDLGHRNFLGTRTRM
jgi:hypothetical protein